VVDCLAHGAPVAKLLLVTCGLAVNQQCQAVANRSLPILYKPTSRQPIEQVLDVAHGIMC
jgi:hypothetical protein